MNDPYTRTLDASEIPRVRTVAWGKESCRWADHWWIKFLMAERNGEDLVVMVLCRECGRTPLEALSALPIVIPTTPTEAREIIANYLMDARVDGPYWKPPSKLTYQEAMRKYADEILRELDRG